MMILLIILLIIIATYSSSHIISQPSELKEIKTRIENRTTIHCHGAHSNTVKSFLSKSYRSFLGEKVALIYPFCLQTNELGNRLGNFFNELACAEIIGADFITIHKQFTLAGSFLGHNNASVQPLVFLNALPEYVIHKNPNSFEVASRMAKDLCKCTQYCWQDKNGAWIKALPSIRNHLAHAIKTYYDHMVDKFEAITSSDVSNRPEGERVPIVPDVAIQYRCGDNLGFNYMYGILPFHVIKNRIPENSEYIYILSDHPSRSAHSPYAPRCNLIMKTMYEYFTKSFPTSVIVIKRGGDMFLDYARLSMAKVAICSASTYCLWPAIANVNVVHFPMTYLIAGVDNANLIVNLTENFNWIRETEIISNFNKFKPWQKIIDVLIGNETY